MKNSKLAWVLIALIFACNPKTDSSEWVLELNQKKFSKNEIKAAYQVYLTLIAQQIQMVAQRAKVSPNQILDYAKDLDSASPEMQQAIKAMHLDKKSFIEQFRFFNLLSMEADKNNYLAKDKNRHALKFINTFYTANLYIGEKVKPDKIKVDSAEVDDYINKLRKQFPRRTSTMPMDQLMELAQQDLFRKKVEEEKAKYVDGIQGKYTWEKNSKVDTSFIFEPDEDEKKEEKKLENTGEHSDKKEDIKGTEETTAKTKKEKKSKK